MGAVAGLPDLQDGEPVDLTELWTVGSDEHQPVGEFDGQARASLTLDAVQQ